ALYICVPPYAHGPAEFAAVEAGVPFFVEKPLATDLRTAEEIAERVAEAGLATATGYHWRYLDTVRVARELLAGREAGLVHCYWLDRVAPPWWWVDRALSGGQVVEQATHVLDLARLLLGEVEHAYAAAVRHAGNAFATRIDDATVATLRFASGAIGTLASTCLLPCKHRAGLQVFADGLALDISESELVTHAGEDLRHLPADQQAAKTRADRAFIDAVQGRAADIRAPYAEALRTHRLGCAIAASVAEGRPVTLEEEP
ncbi:oxidoreductase, partial [Carbonactinospora thermoautotrophica]